jgi:hypothetical protein
MRSIITITLLMFTSSLINAQNVMKLSAGTTIKTSGGVTIVLSDVDLDNDGTIYQGSGEGGFRFTGTQASAIKGSSMPVIGILEVNKTNGGKLLLNRNININSSLNFISGQLDLNGNNILMNATAMIAGETENNRIIGANGGFVEITQNMNAPAGVNAGNLGTTITSTANLGAVTIRRGHTSQSGTGLTNSINRYYLIIPANNNNLNATLRMKYFDAELNTQNESALVIYKSDNSGTDWNNMSQTTRNTNANYAEKIGMSNLTLQTLANDNIVINPGATGVVLSGQRKKATEVTLKWNSLTETSMSGYQIQRRLKNEVDFSDRTFVNTLAPGGNSNSQLSYQNVDANSYADTSYYRLKIVANNATFTYSNIIAVTAKTNGGNGSGGGNPHNKIFADTTATTASAKTIAQVNTAKKITVGPNPNNGNFWFSVNGIQQETIATLYTVDGKQINQFRVINLQQQQVDGLRSGIYFLKVPGFEKQKIIVNGQGANSPAPQQPVFDKTKL